MTWWGPADLLDFARAAGFTVEDRRRVAAIALLASEGCDHYDWTPDGYSASHARGLYALNPRVVTHVASRDLFNPMVSTRVLHELHESHDQSFDFHPVWVSDGGAHVGQLLAELDAGRAWTVRALQVARNNLDTMATWSVPPLQTGDLTGPVGS